MEREKLTQANIHESPWTVKKIFENLKGGESRYKDLLHNSELEGLRQDSFAQLLIEHLEMYRESNDDKSRAEREILSTKLKGHVLVDLGGGRLCRMLSVAEAFGATGYINVDRHITGKMGAITYNPT